MATLEQKITALRSGALGTIESITEEIKKVNDQKELLDKKLSTLMQKRAYLETIEKLEKE